MTYDFNLYLVTDPVLGGGPEAVHDIVGEAIAGGVTVVQLRDKTADDKTFARQAKRLRDSMCEHVPLFVNDRVDIACELGLHLHIGQGDMAYHKARKRLPAHLMLGLSIDCLEQMDQLVAECEEHNVPLPDVVGIGPVWDTATKPDAAPELLPAGVAPIADRARGLGIKSVAIGGIGLANAAQLVDTGVDGICVVSAIMAADDPCKAAKALRASFG